MKPIVVSLLTAALIAVLHLRFIYMPEATRYPLLAMVATAVAGFALWAVWDGAAFVAMALLLFLVNIVGLLLLTEKVVAELVLWRSNRAAAAAQEGHGDE